MGTGDSSDATTDFFDTHRAQCVGIATVLRSVSGAEDIVSSLDKATAFCDAAIANGRLRADMPPSVSTLPEILAKYIALPAKTKSDLAAALKAQVSTQG